MGNIVRVRTQNNEKNSFSKNLINGSMQTFHCHYHTNYKASCSRLEAWNIYVFCIQSEYEAGT